MSWDKNKPAGSTSFQQSDDELRENNDAIETALDAEHRFTTGSNQSGRHSLSTNTTASLGALPSTISGWIAWSTDERTGQRVLMTHDGSSVIPGDVEPVDGSGNPTLPRVNEASKFTSPQYAEWHELTVSGGEVTPLITTSGTSMMWFTADTDVEIKNPTKPGGYGGFGTIFLLEITMDGVGGHTITFDTQYRAVGGTAAIAVSTGSGDRTMLQIIGNRSGNYVVTSLPDYNVG